jgi:hypothetical protein
MQILSVLKDFTGILDSLRIPYMLTGSVAFNLYAIPRATRDIDMVIVLEKPFVPPLINAIRDRFYFNEETIYGEISRKGFFNLIDTESSFKIDLIVRNDEPYEIEKFSRRQKIELDETPLWIITLEDLIISKLRWIQKIESDTQKNDIRLLLENPSANRDYISFWVTKLHLKTFGLMP